MACLNLLLILSKYHSSWLQMRFLQNGVQCMIFFLFMQRLELSDSKDSYMRVCTPYAYLTETST